MKLVYLFVYFAQRVLTWVARSACKFVFFLLVLAAAPFLAISYYGENFMEWWQSAYKKGEEMASVLTQAEASKRAARPNPQWLTNGTHACVVVHPGAPTLDEQLAADAALEDRFRQYFAAHPDEMKEQPTKDKI